MTLLFFMRDLGIGTKRDTSSVGHLLICLVCKIFICTKTTGVTFTLGFFSGQCARVHVHVRRIPIEDIPEVS